MRFHARHHQAVPLIRAKVLLPPRLGLIQWVVDSYRRASCDDALLVPVSISFDQIAEVDDYVAMQQGTPKRKESLSWFVAYISGMKAKNGRIYLRFAEPVSCGRFHRIIVTQCGSGAKDS